MFQSAFITGLGKKFEVQTPVAQWASTSQISVVTTKNITCPIGVQYSWLFN